MEPIQDYAIIGDCRSAALVSRHGSIDWLCWPRFDSPSLFAALLDEDGGCWRVAPAQPARITRRYIEGTNVLQTDFETDGGRLRLTDLMPVASDAIKRRHLFPEHEVLRCIECRAGEAEVEMVFAPRPGYGRTVPRIRAAGQLGLRIETGCSLLNLRTDMPLQPWRDGSVRGRVRLRAGDTLHFSLTYAKEWPAVLPPLGSWTRAAIDRSVRWWQDWSARLTYDGPGRDAVLRSALALRLLVYAPSGAVVAAPTTSLPERMGGDLNWDYRYCWLRDASFTTRALFGLGYADEAEAFVSWLLHSTRLTRPELRILYDVHGETPRREWTRDGFTGYRGSRPVRIGNAAARQLQLDVYGEVIDATTHFIRTGGSFDRETQRMLCAFGAYVCRNWRHPDEGIWEPRSGRAHHTYSRVMCWVALERLLALHEKGHLPKAPFAAFAQQRDLIRREVEDRCWNAGLQTYVAEVGGTTLDASLLLLPWYGFEAASSARMRRTYACIRQHLGADGHLLYRYRTAESPGEGAFGICGFWAVEFLALGGGSVEEAQDAFHEILTYGNDLGLFAEEIDPHTKDALGNFPQAFTHVGLINAALSIARRQQGLEPRDHRVHGQAEAATAGSRV